jgi:regulation of enolase protein 1 (concanavalin A-like superfamily)
MKLRLRSFLLLALLTVATCHADEILFQDDFKDKLGEGWSWTREHREGWRVTRRGLEVRVEPGNMWGAANDARNVLVRAAPGTAKDEIEISVSIENKPAEQYEQTDLVWYYDDSHMVKLGQEMVDGKLSIVMGREEKDRTRTISIIPLETFSVRLRFLVKDNRIRGQFRASDSKDWRDAGESDLPAPANGKAHISLQCYQGPANAERWARITGFLVRRVSK